MHNQQGEQARDSIVSLMHRVEKATPSTGVRNYVLQDIYLEYPLLKSLIQRYGFSMGLELASDFEVFAPDVRQQQDQPQPSSNRGD